MPDDSNLAETPPTVHGPDGTANGADNAAKYAPRVPAAVRRAAARAEELQAQIAAESAPEAAGEVEAAAGQDLPAEQEQPPQRSPEPPQSPVQGDDWQNRYRTLQGKYDHEIPQLRLHIQHLEGLIATMQAPPARDLAPSPEVEIPEEDYTTYGPDFVDSTRRWARAEVQRDLARQQQQIDELKSYASQTTGDRTRDKVRAELSRDPEIGQFWEQMDADPAFNAWLGDFDPFSGRLRLEMLREAYAGGDAVRTGRFFKAFLNEHTDILRAPAAPPDQTPYPVTRPSNGGHYGNGAAPMDLSAYAAPGRASNATPGPGAPDRRIWTNRDIQAFYAGRLKGRYRGREAEADRLERDILAAAQEGRVSQ